MATVTQFNPWVVQADPPEPFQPAYENPGCLYHPVQTDRLFVGQATEVSPGVLRYRWVEIGGVQQGVELTPPVDPEGLKRTLYHPIATNRLYVQENDNGTLRWVNIAGVETGDSPTPPVVGPALAGSFYHPNGTNQLWFLDTNDNLLTWVNIADVAVGTSIFPPSDPTIKTSFYHPLGTNQLWFLEQSGGTQTWINIAGLQTNTTNNVEYYVDIVTGSNTTGNGSNQHPFQTLEFAYSMIPHSPSGTCRIILVGFGPYFIPESLQGVVPQGDSGEPLLIYGDGWATEFVGVVTAVGGALIQFGGIIAENAWQGLVYHGLTGSSTGQYYQIGHNTSTDVYSIGGTFGASPGDTFEILRPLTRIEAATNLTLGGPGKIGFYRCQIACDTFNIIDASVLFDACILEFNDVFSGRLQSTCQFMAVGESEDFSVINDVGTQIGKTGMFFNNPVQEPGNSVRMFDGSVGIGYVIARGGIDTWTAGQWILQGTDIDLLNAGANSFGIVCKANGYLEMNQGYHHLVLGGASGVGIRIDGGAKAILSSATIVIEQAGVAALIVEGGGILNMDTVSGSIGNGYGVLVRDGGFLFNSGGNTVTGTGGDVQIYPSSVSLGWGQIGYMSFSYPKGFSLRRREVPVVDYDATIIDELVAYTLLGAPVTVTLPDPALTGATSDYVKRMKVQDESGLAGTHNITLVAAVGSVNGNAIIDTDYGGISVYTEGTSWFVDGRS